MIQVSCASDVLFPDPSRTKTSRTDCPMRRDHDRTLWFDLLEGSIVGRGPDMTGGRGGVEVGGLSASGPMLSASGPI